METITTYKTKDGHTFDSREEAIRHENEINRREEVENIAIQLDNGEVLTKADIKSFFGKLVCNINCPFNDECNELYSEVRCHSKSTFTLCDVIKKRINVW